MISGRLPFGTQGKQVADAPSPPTADAKPAALGGRRSEQHGERGASPPRRDGAWSPHLHGFGRICRGGRSLETPYLVRQMLRSMAPLQSQRRRKGRVRPSNPKQAALRVPMTLPPGLYDPMI